jgi:hypothetical protein
MCVVFHDFYYDLFSHCIYLNYVHSFRFFFLKKSSEIVYTAGLTKPGSILPAKLEGLSPPQECIPASAASSQI